MSLKIPDSPGKRSGRSGRLSTLSATTKSDTPSPPRKQRDTYEPGSWEYEVAANYVNSVKKSERPLPNGVHSLFEGEGDSTTSRGMRENRKGKRAMITEDMYTPPPAAETALARTVIHKQNKSMDAISTSKRSSGGVTFDGTSHPPIAKKSNASLHNQFGASLHNQFGASLHNHFGAYVDQRFGLGQLPSGARVQRSDDTVETSNSDIDSAGPRPLKTKTSVMSMDTTGNRNSDIALLEIQCAPVPWEPDPLIPVGSVLFLFGFICPPLWWIGSFFPRPPKSKLDYRWIKINRYVSAVSVLLVLGIIGVAIWYVLTHGS